MVAQAKTSFRISYLGSETVGRAALAALQRAVTKRAKISPAASFSAIDYNEKEGEAAIHKSELGNDTLESLLSDLARADATSAQSKNYTPLYLKFKALVYLHPEDCVTLGKLLVSALPRSVKMQILAGALSAVGHAQAQAAITTAIQARSKDWLALSLLIPVLGGLNNPTPNTEAALRSRVQLAHFLRSCGFLTTLQPACVLRP
jgi:hypothetical protein